MPSYIRATGTILNGEDVYEAGDRLPTDEIPAPLLERWIENGAAELVVPEVEAEPAGPAVDEPFEGAAGMSVDAFLGEAATFIEDADDSAETLARIAHVMAFEYVTRQRLGVYRGLMSL